MTLFLVVPTNVWAQQFDSVTTPLPDPEFAPPQKTIEYQIPAVKVKAPVVEQPVVSPWSSQGIDAIRSAVGAAISPQEEIPAPEASTVDPMAIPPVADPSTPFPGAGSVLSPVESKQHHLPIGQPAAKDISVKEDQGMISLMVRDAPLRQVIALVAETQKLNIVFASPAEVPVTASFDRVPWQQVIEALLSISGHTWTINENIIFVTSIEAADFVSPEAGGRAVEVFELDFASAVDVDQTVQGLVSPAGHSWILESSSDDNRRTREVVAVIDYPGNLARIRDYICQVDQPPRQVLIEANILQVELSDDCKNGINFETLASFDGNTINFETRGFANPAATTAFFMEVDGKNLDGLVEMLKTTSDAKALATPKILAVSGQQSHIQIGSQLGFRVTTTTQTGTFESIQFLDVGVVLTVTPRITRDGRVLMRVKPKVSKGQVDAATGLPSEDTTEVETDILLNDGQGMVIGGLIQESDTTTASKIPWISDLPYVGILFQKRQVIKERSEIIITLIPHILPYEPMIDAREQSQYMRTQDRLTYGPLNRVPRPYEARLPDTFANPRRPVASVVATLRPHVHAAEHVLPGDMISFPPIDEPGQYEMLPGPEEMPYFEVPIEQSSYSEPWPSTQTR